MQGFNFIQDLAVILVVAGAMGWLCQRIGLSVIVGYVAAGVIVGPFTPPFAWVTDVERIETLAQLGLVFLMFSIGLRLSLRRLRKLGLSLVIAVFGGAAAMYFLTRLAAIALNLGGTESLFLAAMLMVSSSSIIGKILQETGGTHERAGQIAMGVSVLEDVVAVVMLTVLNSVIQFGGAREANISETLGGFGAFVALAGIMGLLIVPWLLRKLSISAGEELQTLGTAGLLFGLAVIAEKAGFSLALGAFLLGTIVAETQHRTQVERTFEGLRDVFTAVFFAAIGIQIDLSVLAEWSGLIAGVAVFTIVARAAATTLGLSLTGTSVKDALRVGLIVTPIGEFSFIIAQLGIANKQLDARFYPLAVGVSLLTTLTAPPLTKHSEKISTWLLAKRPQWLRVWHSYFYVWLQQLQARRKRNLIWQLSRKRIVQIGVEMLFVTGLLIFSEPLRVKVETWLGRDWLFPNGPTWLFWLVMTLVVLAPLVAIWRNLSALCLLYAQISLSGHAQAARLRPIVEGGFKIAGGIGMWVWLSAVLPSGPSAKWILLTMCVVAVVALLLLRRRLIYWHSELEVGLRDVFEGTLPARVDTDAPWLRPHGDWELQAIDCVLPDLADCRGKRIAELDLRNRFGCTLVSIERQGSMVSLPAPTEVLYARDKVLLIGTTEQVNAGKKFLQTVSGAAEIASEFEDVRMETVTVPPGSAAAGKDLKTLSPAQLYQVQIAGIRRGNIRLSNPSGEEIVAAGDELLVLGTPEQIGAFREWVGEGTNATEAQPSR
jgi:monovalent cation:H+ antiporter-2, CPA2 family